MDYCTYAACLLPLTVYDGGTVNGSKLSKLMSLTAEVIPASPLSFRRELAFLKTLGCLIAFAESNSRDRLEFDHPAMHWCLTEDSKE